MPVRAPILLIVAVITALALSKSAIAAKVLTVHKSGSDAALVLIHGLEGSAAVSFTNETTGLSWKDLILADTRPLVGPRTLASFDIYAVDYSDVFQGANIVDVSVEDMATQVATALETHGLLQEYNHIWIIAHSLGGIVTKRVLIKWLNAGYKRYLDRVIGVSLLGVPSNGAPLADIGSTEYGQVIAAWLGINARHVSDLRTIGTTNTFLKAVDNDWAAFLTIQNRGKSLPWVSCAYETIAEYTLDPGFFDRLFGSAPKITIVKEIYTKTTCHGVPQAIVKSHIALPKPSGPDDPIEDWLLDAVRKAFLILDDAGETFGEADQVGALWNLIDHIRRGHERLDAATGLPWIDETIEVPQPDVEKLKRLRLGATRYAGATWADVLERVAAANSCVIVHVRDKARRDIVVSLSQPRSCGDSPETYACTVEECE